MANQREDTPKTGPAPRSAGEPLPDRKQPEGIGNPPINAERQPGKDRGHVEIGQFPDTGDFGPDDIKERRG